MSLAHAQTWQPLANQPTFGASTALLLTDGTVMVQALASGTGSRAWWRLTPDSSGDYVNGTWSELASLPAGYGPLYYASAVLPSGQVVINGGEYNLGDSIVESNKGAIYNPVANKWRMLAAPSGWTQIGDGQSVVLSNGDYMLGNCCTSVQAILDASTLTWTITGSGKADANSEEGWTLLPDGSVLTVDVTDSPNTELYNPSSGTWSSAGKTPVNLSAYSEMGPAILRPDGTVFATGASGNTAIYTPGTGGAVGTWTAGPVFPVIDGKQIDIADGPGALLPNGDVLVAASPDAYKTPMYFYEFDGTNLNSVPGTPNAPTDSSYYGRMLVLPTGQVLFTDGSADVEVFTGPGAPNPAWAPVISSTPKAVTPGKTYNISGVGFNGLSQGAAYGDDAQSATNYPLVRITISGIVYYCRTSDFSSMAVASPATVSAHFEVPAGVPVGSGELVVVANGIASTPVAVTVK
jgi:hypothetical protein